jgi:hypothetical protein
MTLLEYHVTRPVPLSRRITVLLVIIGIAAIAAITAINVAVVGYEYVSFTSTTYQEPYILWYERVLPSAWFPTSRTCQAASIKLNEGLNFVEITKPRYFDA